MAVFIVFETPIGGEEKIIKIELLEELNFTNMAPGKKFRYAIKNNSTNQTAWLFAINKSRFVHFYTGNIFEVQKLRETLLEANIKTLVKDESESARFAGFGSTVMVQQLFIPSDKIEQAKRII